MVLFFKKGLLLFTLVPGIASAAPPVSVTAAWARASLPHQDTSAAYMVLQSATADTLTSVTMDQGMAMLHQSTRKGGMAGMEDVDGLALPAARAVALAPGGTHVMLMDLKQPLRPGDTLRLTLHFAHAAPLTVAAPVRPVGATGP